MILIYTAIFACVFENITNDDVNRTHCNDSRIKPVKLVLEVDFEAFADEFRDYLEAKESKECQVNHL